MSTRKSTKTIEMREKEIIAEFVSFPDVDTKYMHLFQLGEHLPKMSANHKTKANLVKGCQSLLWFHFYTCEGRVYLEADSDSLVIKGIAAILVQLLTGLPPKEVETINMDFLDRLDIWKLASTRNTGLMAMLDHIKQKAHEMDKSLSNNEES